MAEKTRDEELRDLRREYPLLYPITLAVLVVIILLLVGRVVYSTPEANQAWGYGVNVFTSVVSTVATVLILDELNRRRDKREAKAEYEEELRQQLLADAASPSNEVAKNAIHQIYHKGWLKGKDGLLKGEMLSDANLQDAYLGGANLEKVSLDGANLQSADLRNASLQEANLSEADMQGAYLVMKDLRGANLQRGNLQEAVLTFANLQHTNLTNTDLRGADLGGAKMKGAIIVADLLKRTDFDEATVLPDFFYWSSDTDMRRFTDPDHPDFWQPDWANQDESEE